jgi:hypothetical protein
MVGFWASLAICWAVFYKMWPIRALRNTFTMHRWATNPFQLYSLLLLLQVSVNQIVIGVPFNGPQEALDRTAQIALAGCNLLGALISAYGLHLRNIERALWVELFGYVALAGSLGIYVGLVFLMQPLPNTSFGLALSEAFVFASLHRSIQIIRYKRARRRENHVTDRAADILRKLEKGDPLA